LDGEIIYTGLQYLSLNGQDEIPLSEDLALVRPNERLLAGRWSYAMSEREFEDEASASRFLVCTYPSWVSDGNAYERGMRRFYSGLMAFQIIKPVQTSGFVYSRQRIERRGPMDAGPWARMRRFDDELLLQAPPMIDRLQRVADGDDAERKNAVTLLQLGLETYHPYITGLLWVMGLEAIFNSPNREAFQRRLCDCLGPATLAFPDWNRSIETPKYTVEDVAIHLYTLRSKLAHGVDLRKAVNDEKYPVDLLAQATLTEFLEPTMYAYILCEAACFLLCQVLQKVI